MEKNSLEVLLEYDQKKSLYKRFGDAIENLIKTLVGTALNPHQINHRVKDRESLENKLTKKNNKYNSLQEITDILGVRIICFFEDDIDKIAKLFEKEFEVDKPNSNDKRQVDVDRFGYRSLHYVASINTPRLLLTEYKDFENLKSELQIRSILQHSWAEIEHDIGYKGESEIPNTAKRTFYRVAALLEQADIEFVKLGKEITNHVNIIKEQFISREIDIPIDKAALIAFIKESKTLMTLRRL